MPLGRNAVTGRHGHRDGAHLMSVDGHRAGHPHDLGSELPQADGKIGLSHLGKLLLQDPRSVIDRGVATANPPEKMASLFLLSTTSSSRSREGALIITPTAC